MENPFDLDMRMREKVYPAIGLQTDPEFVLYSLILYIRNAFFNNAFFNNAAFDASLSSTLTSSEISLRQFLDHFSVSS